MTTPRLHLVQPRPSSSQHPQGSSLIAYPKYNGLDNPDRPLCSSSRLLTLTLSGTRPITRATLVVRVLVPLPTKRAVSMVASTMDALAPMSSGGSSPLSSLASQSPETPFYLPSPTSQDLSDLCLPPPELDQVKVTGEVDGPPPVKRRKTIERKPRVTRYLDLQSTTPVSPVTCPAEQKPQLDTLLKVLRQKRKIVVIAGAGISVSAGSE